MVRLFGYILLGCALAALAAGCASTESVWRSKALASVQQLEREDAARIRPEAFRSIQDTVRMAEKLLVADDDDRLAELQYQLAYQQAQVLKNDLAAQRAQLAEEARRKAELEQARQEEERRKKEEALKAAEEERRRKAEAAAKTAGSKTAPQHDDGNGHGVKEKIAQPAVYTVRRGESLPQIAARPEIYNEAGLWPLIYRANRDQVRDPYQLWPGQVLKIPRSYSREEAVEARRQAHRRP